MKLAATVYVLIICSVFVNSQRLRNVVNKSPNCLGLLSTLSTATEVDGKFTLLLELGSKIYEPFEKYSIILRSNDINTHFKEFNIIAESADKTPKVSVGRFERYKEALTKYSDDCPNGVMQSSLLPKQEIKVKWIAPPSSSGCIRFRAAVRANLEQWITNTNSMSFIVCEENQLLDGQPKVLVKCTACDEAKYGVEITGLWSRNTHPVDYPKNAWDAAISDVIGASHTNSFRIFSKDEVASEPLRRMAEDGQSKYLVQLMNDREKRNEVRTIIKARGITHPLLNGKTFAEFRVDRDHHLMSLVAKLEPSPDWFIGVDSLELCTKNGSWIDEKQMNLYLYDAGTDGGSGYENANKLPLKFKEKVYQLTNLHPENSPFYNLNESKIKPFARIKVQKQRLFPSKKPCRMEEAIEEEEEPDDSLERNLVYGDENNVSPPMFNRPGFGYDNGGEYGGGGDYLPPDEYGTGEMDENHGREVNSKETNEQSDCATAEYGAWSECMLNNDNPNPRCGPGKARRTRELLNPANAIYCEPIVLLTDEVDCEIQCETGSLSYQTGNKDGYYGRGGGYDGSGRRGRPPTRYRSQEDIYAPKQNSWVHKKDYESENDRTGMTGNRDNGPNSGNYDDTNNEDTNNYGPNRYDQTGGGGDDDSSNEDYMDQNRDLNRDANRDQYEPTSRRPSYTEEDAFYRTPDSCKATEWSDWSSCFGDCSDYRYRNRTRSLITFESICLGIPLVQQQACTDECGGSNRRGDRQRMRLNPRNVTPRMLIRSTKADTKLNRNDIRTNSRTDARMNSRYDARTDSRIDVQLRSRNNVKLERRINKNNIVKQTNRRSNVDRSESADQPVREKRDKVRAASKSTS